MAALDIVVFDQPVRARISLVPPNVPMQRRRDSARR
jgi:hypothetical protein